MGSFEEGLRRLAILGAQAAERAPAPSPSPLDPRVLRGQVYRGGERVRDLVTGQEGVVEHSSFVHATFAAP